MRTESRNSNELVSKQWNSNVRQHLSLNYADVINWGRRCVQLERELFEARRSKGEERQNRGMITVGRSDESRKRHHQRRTKEQSKHPREYIGEQSRQSRERPEMGKNDSLIPRARSFVLVRWIGGKGLSIYAEMTR